MEFKVNFKLNYINKGW